MASTPAFTLVSRRIGEGLPRQDNEVCPTLCAQCSRGLERAASIPHCCRPRHREDRGQTAFGWQDGTLSTGGRAGCRHSSRHPHLPIGATRTCRETMRANIFAARFRASRAPQFVSIARQAAILEGGDDGGVDIAFAADRRRAGQCSRQPRTARSPPAPCAPGPRPRLDGERQRPPRSAEEGPPEARKSFSEIGRPGE